MHCAYSRQIGSPMHWAVKSWQPTQAPAGAVRAAVTHVMHSSEGVPPLSQSEASQGAAQTSGLQIQAVNAGVAIDRGAEAFLAPAQSARQAAAGAGLVRIEAYSVARKKPILGAVGAAEAAASVGGHAGGIVGVRQRAGGHRVAGGLGDGLGGRGRGCRRFGVRGRRVGCDRRRAGERSDGDRGRCDEAAASMPSTEPPHERIIARGHRGVEAAMTSSWA